MSAASNTAATALDAIAASAQTTIDGYTTTIGVHAAVLTAGQESAAIAYWVDHCLRAKSILPLASLMFLSDTPLDVNQRATKWMALKAEKMLQQKYRGQIVDFAAQCRNGDQIHDSLQIPLTATALEVQTACEDAARRYMVNAGNDEGALEVIGRRLTS